MRSPEDGLVFIERLTFDNRLMRYELEQALGCRALPDSSTDCRTE
jgi:hypothetical protein